MKTVILEPLGGLANRIRAVESAYNFSIANNSKLIVVWEQNGWLNATYEDCFESLPNVEVINLNYNGTSVASKVKRRLLDGYKYYLKKRYTSSAIGDAQIEELFDKLGANPQAIKASVDSAVNGKGIYIKCCYEFYPNLNNLNLSIKHSIRAFASDFLKKNQCDIGIHIRRTDHVEAISNSPLHLFKDQISNALAQWPDYKFYLSTDSAEVAQELQTQFKDKLVTGVSDRRRDSTEGIRSALLDLYCLGSCKEIWGSDKSSFSDRAARMNKIPLKIISLQTSS
ncbi:O-fucosyltransferase family protein [Pedobacter endophyticus]|uniref:Glycosyl transferase family 11 n=1 Tax=Pedobacter endophyticus TaxID=2789740 RepID=A0A7S9KZW2_9SPHI|nr:hypothetical protein [Pedobacter endophyticus]QPH39932.1 hypothetical protein IZT61_01190 [Pedobacter endophyticus]